MTTQDRQRNKRRTKEQKRKRKKEKKQVASVCPKALPKGEVFSCSVELLEVLYSFH